MNIVEGCLLAKEGPHGFRLTRRVYALTSTPRQRTFVVD